MLHRGEEVTEMILKCEARNWPSNALVFASRSTLCSVMAQLTEDIQPSFETTLKSKAVSEKCNVKFTCVVSGRSVHLLASAQLFVGVTETVQIVCGVERQDVTNLKTKEGISLWRQLMNCFILRELLLKHTRPYDIQAGFSRMLCFWLQADWMGGPVHQQQLFQQLTHHKHDATA